MSALMLLGVRPGSRRPRWLAQPVFVLIIGGGVEGGHRQCMNPKATPDRAWAWAVEKAESGTQGCSRRCVTCSLLLAEAASSEVP